MESPASTWIAHSHTGPEQRISSARFFIQRGIFSETKDDGGEEKASSGEGTTGDGCFLWILMTSCGKKNVPPFLSSKNRKHSFQRKRKEKCRQLWEEDWESRAS